MILIRCRIENKLQGIEQEKIIMSINRRSFLGNSILTGAGVYANINYSWASSLLEKSNPDVEIEMVAKKERIQVLPGGPTTAWSYRGKLIRGEPWNLQNIKGSYLGPTIRVKQGQRIRINFKNKLDEASIIHWHGLDVDEKNDGHPRHAVGNGGSFTYDFVVNDRAGMYWYHPHPHGRTGYQVYMGLAGLFIVHDSKELALNLPSKDREVPMVIQDRRFDEDNQFLYRSSMMGGAYGDKLFINGKKEKNFKLKNGAYRLRLLNGCNARNFNLAWSDGRPLTIIGTDGGLLQKTEKIDNTLFGPAERLDIWVDFSNIELGSSIQLINIPIGRGSKYPIASFEMSELDNQQFELPEKLSEYEILNSDQAINFRDPKEFNLRPKRGRGWTINGLSYEMDNVKDYEVVKHNDIEVWEFHNPSMMAHPMHIHGSHFQILKREGENKYNTFDLGRKDTFLILPGERIQIIKRFGSHKGTFLYHCHNLEHEDRSMMRNYRVI